MCAGWCKEGIWVIVAVVVPVLVEVVVVELLDISTLRFLDTLLSLLTTGKNRESCSQHPCSIIGYCYFKVQWCSVSKVESQVRKSDWVEMQMSWYEKRRLRQWYGSEWCLCDRSVRQQHWPAAKPTACWLMDQRLAHWRRTREWSDLCIWWQDNSHRSSVVQTPVWRWCTLHAVDVDETWLTQRRWWRLL